jgi:hypothetical protein
MGILDDAIRQHLDLKRKHGASEEELQRQEEEALGPARRQVAQQAESSEAADDHGSTATALEEDAVREDGDAATGSAEAETEFMPPASGAPEPPPAGAHEDEHEPMPEAGEPADADGAADESDSGEPEATQSSVEDLEHSGDPPRDRFAALVDDEDDSRPDHGATEEHDRFAEDDSQDEPLTRGDAPEDGDDGEDGDGDVLEDTPDFLQETPEHDRLWFEQKPPRDFDFD